MMNFKSNKHSTCGFTLIEVLLAVAIIGLVMTPIFITQSTFLQSVSRLSRRMARIFFAKQFLIDSAFAAQLKEEKKEDITVTIEKKLDDPETIVTYQVKKLPKDSVLSTLPDLYLENAQARWQRDGIDQKEILVSFIFEPKPSEKKEA